MLPPASPSAAVAIIIIIIITLGSAWEHTASRISSDLSEHTRGCTGQNPCGTLGEHVRRR
jgi:hypothetical protein